MQFSGNLFHFVSRFSLCAQLAIGAKGTVIGIEPERNHIAGFDVTDNDIFALEILMDTPFKIDSELCHFEKHQVFRTRSTNMLVNISHGRNV